MQEELDKMQRVWLPQILEKKLKNHIKCQSCGKYSKSKDFKTECKREVSIETTYTDAGYGDDVSYELFVSGINVKLIIKK